MRILYIEDEPADAQLVERYVKLTPHKLVLVNNIVDAQAALDTPPDLILVDVLLAGSRSGFTFVKELRRQGYAQPIIAVTALSTPYDVEQCYQAGFDDLLMKPYAVSQLVDLLNKYTSLS